MLQGYFTESGGEGREGVGFFLGILGDGGLMRQKCSIT